MGSKALLLLKEVSPKPNLFIHYKSFSSSFSSASSKALFHLPINISNKQIPNCLTSATTTGSSLQPPDVPRLAETARISLTPDEAEEFAPKIQQVIDWFGQLQAVDLNSIEPAIRADTEGDNLRDDIPETFENGEGLIASVPSYEESYIKVPKVLNKE